MLFDNGAGGGQPGHPLPGFEQSFASFPIPGTTRRLYLGAGGALAGAPPAQRGADKFTWNANRPPTNFTGNTAAGEGRPLDRYAAVPVVPEPGGQRRLLRDRRRSAPTPP